MFLCYKSVCRLNPMFYDSVEANEQRNIHPSCPFLYMRAFAAYFIPSEKIYDDAYDFQI